ncbi:MAG: hypothetical protein H7A24_02085 [Leptospiraceae bacterium]|nr:hypothetical protein [Leptospiraceae bacterium]MCP5510639.1 hypothetical protein [Leptospiraceae bacterium]
MKTFFLIGLFLYGSILFSEESNNIHLPFPNLSDEIQVEEKVSGEVILPRDTREKASLENSSLPHQKENSESNTPKNSAKKKNEIIEDPYKGSYPRGSYHLNRADKQSALKEFNQSSSSGEANANLAKLEVIRLLANERKTSQAKSIIESIDNTDLKFKAYFELGMGLENSAKTKKEKEESIPIYLHIISEAPRQLIFEKGKEEKADKDAPPPPNPLLPRSRFTLANLLFQLGEDLPALDHLAKIILDFPNSEYVDDALYLSGRIYEDGQPGLVRDSKKAKKYYKIFLNRKNEEMFKNSIYRKEVEERYKNL